MTKSLLIFLFIGAFFSKDLKVQAANITGKIIDEQKAPMPFVAIALFQINDSSLVKTNVTDVDGSFEFEQIPTGNYFLKVNFTGYTTYVSGQINVETNAIELPAINLQPNKTVLSEVEISVLRPLVEIKADKTVFNVEGTINASGTSALELLRKAPGVTVDNNNNISLKGKAGVVVYIDGKRSYLSGDDLSNFLLSLNSSQIQSFEIISNPSAKYDAQGSAGIINIKLKKEQKQNANAIINLDYAQGFYPKYNGSINSNYRKKKINLFLNYGTGKNIYRGHHELDRTQGGAHYLTKSTERSQNFSNNLKTGFDFNINAKNTIGVIATGNLMPAGSSNTLTNTEIGPENQAFDKLLLVDNTVSRNNHNINYNLNYRFSDTTGTAFGMDVDFGQFRNRRNADLSNRFYAIADNSFLNALIYKNDIATNIDLYTIKADYERELKKGKIEFGGKYLNTKTSNAFDFYDVIDGNVTINEDRTNHFNYTEQVSALYSSYQIQIKKFNIQTGLRVEHTRSLGELSVLRAGVANTRVDRNYTNFFPNLGFSYEASKKNSFGASFSRRIVRPDYHDLNPFQYKIDEYTYHQGNPFLIPEYSSIYEINHSYNSFLNTSLSYTNTTNFYTDVLFPLADGVTIKKTVNLAYRRNVSLNTNFSVPLKKWWNIYASFWGNYVKNMADYGDGNVVDVFAYSGGLYAQNTFSLNKTLNFELSGWYGAPGLWDGNMKSKGMGAIDMGFQKKILDKKGTIRLSFTDVLFTSQWGITTDINGMHITGGGYWESRQIKLNFSYIFGNDKLKSNKKTGLEEEEKRLKGD